MDITKILAKRKEAIASLPNDVGVEIYGALIDYATTGVMPELTPMASGFVTIMLDDIKKKEEENKRRGRRRAARKNGNGDNDSQSEGQNTVDTQSEGTNGNEHIYNNIDNNNNNLYGQKPKSDEEKGGEKPLKGTLAETLSDRKKAFKESLQPFVKTYGEEMINNFFNYWSEANWPKTKMRCEDNKTWELPVRLAFWKRNSEKYQENHNANQQQAIDPRRGTDAPDISPEEYDKGF